ncbi:MAG: DUF192 domain-containing protein [Victivallaceae bacterium]
MILNLSKKKYISKSPFYATSLIQRTRGMIGRSFDGAPFDAMVFGNCNTIHSLFMSIPIDVLFIDMGNNICDMRQALPPWVFMVRCRNAFTTIELPCGVINTTGTEIGDKVDLSSELTMEFERELRGEKIISPVESVISFKESGK